MARLLIIDDDPDLREMMRFLFSETKYEVLQAGDGLEGLRLAWQEHPDLILLDVMMPNMDGKQVLRRLKSLPETNGIPVIMLTAVAAASNVQAMIASGAKDYVVKPFEPYTLLERVNKALTASVASTASKPETETGLIVIAHTKSIQAELLARQLHQHGRTIITRNGNEALELVITSQAKVLFAANNLDGMSGTELVQRLRQENAVNPVYLVGLLSQEGGIENKRNMLSAGFDDVLEMPPDRDEVQAILNRATQPRTSYAQVRDGVVVLVVVALNSAEASTRLRDAIIDYIEAKFTRFVIDLGYSDNSDFTTFRALLPLFCHLTAKGVGIRFVTRNLQIQDLLSSQPDSPEAFSSLDAAFIGWE